VVVAGAPDVPVRSVAYTEAQNPDTGETGRSLAITDREPPTRGAQPFQGGLDDAITYYYAAWEDPGTGYPGAPSWQAFSIATGDFGSSARLFAMLPAVHRYYDDPASGPQPGTGVPGSWQLRRFLEVVGPALDQARSLGEALQSLKDVFAARADVLPYLGHWIGWEVDRTQPTHRQRTDVLVAPEVFSTVGTLPNIEALVHRSTGWTCQAKEFVNNVFRTNFVEDLRLWEIWQAPPAAGVLTLPIAQAQVTQAVDDSVDARPALAAEPGGGAPWLFWHTTRTDAGTTPPSTRRQIWMARLDGSVPPRPVMQGAPDDAPNLTYADEWPTAIADGGVVRLFWVSDRGGSAGIWTRTLAGGVPGPATRLTKHPAGDHCPAVARDAAGTLWLFWHSSRRGPTDIWAMTLASGAVTWSAPARLTAGQPRDQMPAAFLDAANQLRLTWSADLGDRSRILQATLTGGLWSTPVLVSSLASDVRTFRDEAPAALQLGAVVWVFWSSNQDGIYRLWASQQVGAGWSPPVTVTTGRHDEKEPAAFLDASAGGALRLLFRTQQSGERFRSRTVDMSDLGAVQPGFFGDRWHYTYSVATDPTSYYARDVVGLYITPGQSANLDEADRVRTLVEPFRPLPVRFVWFVQPPVVTETVYAPVDLQESYLDSADYLGPVADSYSVVLPQWSVLHTNTPGHVSANPADLTTLWHRVFYPAPM
jgi:phage tail-like protein